MERTIVHLLRAAVTAYPDHVALRHGARELSYGELWRRVLAVVGFCREQGIAPGEPVVLALPNDLEYAIAWFGLLAAGVVVAPVAPQSPAPRLIRLLRQLEARWAVGSAQGSDWVAVREAIPNLTLIAAEGDATLIPGALPWGPVVAAPPSPPDYARLDEPNTLAAVLSTSGTTGDPKGVMLTHRNLGGNARAILGYLEIGHDDVGLCVLPLHYAFGSSILNTHLAAGSTLVLARGMAWPQALRALFGVHRVSIFYGVPSTFYHLLAHRLLAGEAQTHLRIIAQAGGGLRPQAVEEIRALLPQARLYVMYGQTEATARLTWLPPERIGEKRGSIGLPIPGVTITIRDEQGNALPPGEVGELCARGDGIMAGYWNNPAATAAALREGELHTGDLAWRDEEGYLYLVGRSDEMIKSGGHRIAPSMVEEVICMHPQVEQAAVVGVEDPLLGQVVRAVVVAREGCRPEGAEILRLCHSELPPWMVPRQLLFVAGLPMTESGKVKRKLLSQMGESDAAPENVGFAV